MVHVIRKENETSSSFVRRFVQRIQASKVLKESKSKKFYQKPLAKNARRKSAIERTRKSAQYAELRKLGKVK